MAEYVEREAFKEKYLCCGYLPEMSEEEFDTFPAADVAPVVHAQWIEDGSGIIICPKCNRGYNLVPQFTHYCPNCGAKMDGGDCIALD